MGKAAVPRCARAYAAAYRFRWEKASFGFTVNDDLAFERYRYRSTEVDRRTGHVTIDVGKGVNIILRGPDGRWRVAIDGWNANLPRATCGGTEGRFRAR